MNIRKVRFVLFLALTVSMPVLSARAQGIFRIGHYVDSVLTQRYQRSNIDTTYVIRPKTKWTLTGRLNVAGASINAEGLTNGQHFTSEMKADYKSTLSLGVSYLGLSVNLSLNPAKMLGKYSDFELNFRTYGKRFGFDLVYQDAHNFTGWHENEGQERITLPEDLLTLKTINLNAYYVFNNRRFSYPAAFGNNYIQRRSAGSFLLALSGQGQKGTVSGDEEYRFSMTNVGIGAGYGFNYVPASGWLLHISALPTFIVYSNTSLSAGNGSVPLHYNFPEVILTGRGAVVKQLGRFFTGASMVFYYTKIGDDKQLSVQNQKWHLRTFFGIRL